MPRFNMDAAARVQSRLVPNGDCLVFSGARTAAGYGSLRQNGRTVYAHRVMTEACHGPAPFDGAVVMHSCDNPPCCKPEHLRWGSHLENCADMYSRGRAHHPGQFGVRNPHARMTAEKVRECRQLRASGVVLRVLAERYGISIAAVHNIVKNRVWREA